MIAADFSVLGWEDMPKERPVKTVASRKEWPCAGYQDACLSDRCQPRPTGNVLARSFRVHVSGRARGLSPSSSRLVAYLYARSKETIYLRCTIRRGSKGAYAEVSSAEQQPEKIEHVDKLGSTEQQVSNKQ